MENKHDLLTEIEAFLAETGMGAAYFGKVAVGNSELVKRLRDGGDILSGTARKVERFIEARREAMK